MTTARQRGDPVRPQASEALVEARRRTGRGAAPSTTGPMALMALQRAAGNSAVNALMSARFRWPPAQAKKEIDGALRELRRDEPVIDIVEKGLKAAKAMGVPVDLEGIRPPASALAVTTTGFGPGNVPAKKPVPPPKKTPAISPLGKAGAKKAVGAKAGPVAPPVRESSGGVGAAQGVALSPEQLLQPPARPTGVRPEDDPAFTKVTGTVKATGKQKRAHAPAKAKSKEAQDAALPPSGDIGSQAKAAKADTMDAQRPGTFDKKAFIAAVKTAIEAKSPKTLSEANNYKSSGKAKEVKGEIKGLVTEGKQGQSADIKAAADAAPDQSKAVPKPVTPMGPEPPGQAVPITATGAVPKPAPPDQLNLAAGKHEANQELADGDVSEQQLAESNEPQFEQALADKKAAAVHADTAPGQYRQAEQQVIAQGKSEATAETATGVNGMQGSRGAALAKLVADKGKTKTKDEAKRAEVTTRIESIYNVTEADTKKILDGIDPQVDKEFNAGEAAARATFENYVSAKMKAYKDDRYGGWLGKLRWLRDKIKGMPAKVNEFYVAGRELYLKQMETTISRVADIVGRELTAAKTRIAKGRGDIAVYVKSLPRDLKKVGAEATKEINDKFSDLESDVDSKQNSLVDSLASKYVEARKGLDDRIEELQAENRGLIDKAISAIKAVVNTVRQLVAMLRNVLSRVAGVVGDIVRHPIRFLGNLIAGVKGGILKFKDQFLDHLRRGLMKWLFGALAEGDVQLPKSFDLKGIIGMLASIFGLTWVNIRKRLALQIGEKAMGVAEQGVEVFKILAGQDVAGLWQMLVEKLGDIKEMIFDRVKTFVKDEIISAGLNWLMGLLSPAGAFIKACKLIYDIVMFFVNNIERIANFVNTVLDSIADVVRGNVSAVVDKVNNALGQMVPILIGFLASVAGLGGIGAKVRELVQRLQKPVNKALDSLIKTGLKLAAPLIRAATGVSKKVKDKVAAGKAWVKGRAEAGKQWAKGKAAAVKAKLRGGDDSPEGKAARLDKALRAGVKVLNRYAGRPVAGALLRPLLAAIRLRFGLTRLEPREVGKVWGLRGEINPVGDATSQALVPTAEEGGLEAPEGKTVGAIAVYRGTHFELTMTEEEYKQAKTREFAKRPDFSQAARELAGSSRPDGSDVGEDQLQAATALVLEALAAERHSGEVSPPWQVRSKDFKTFKSRFDALLHLFIGDMERFRQTIAEPEHSQRMNFSRMPFISTSRNPKTAVDYAQGKLSEHKRTSGVAGRVAIYLFRLADLASQHAVDPIKMKKSERIGIDLLKSKEKEVTFLGAIPGENLEGEILVAAESDAEKAAERAKDVARAAAKKFGGLVQ